MGVLSKLHQWCHEYFRMLIIECLKIKIAVSRWSETFESLKNSHFLSHSFSWIELNFNQSRKKNYKLKLRINSKNINNKFQDIKYGSSFECAIKEFIVYERIPAPPGFFELNQSKVAAATLKQFFTFLLMKKFTWKIIWLNCCSSKLIMWFRSLNLGRSFECHH